MEIEIKSIGDLQIAFNAMKAELETKGAENVKNYEEKIAALETTIDELKNRKPEEPTLTADEAKKLKEDMDITIKAFDKLQVRMKSTGPAAKPEQKSFNENLAEMIDNNADKIKGFKKGAQELKMEMKAVGDMSAAVNFPGSAPFTQDVRTGIIPLPYNRVWLGDILPQGTSSGSSIIYPKENGKDGGAALWTDKTTDKPEMDFNLTAQTAFFKWIAGIVIVEREMLDDIPFLISYLQQKMLISLKIAENDFILNGSADTNPVTGLLAAATAYNGTLTNQVDRIIDAGWGQLVEETFEFYNPTTTILTPRNAVAVGLNKAAGSGEYDLPLGSVAFVNGKLTIGGIDVVTTSQIGAGNFLTFDKNATSFIKRLQPELRMFEDATLAKRNKVMFRVEERATLAIFNNGALVKGTLAP